MTEQPDSAAAILACRQATVVRGRRSALVDVSLAVSRGEIVSIIGPNGAGKSTLILAALGLLPIASGAIELAGRDVAAWPARERARIAAYVPQLPSRSPAFAVAEVVASGRFAHSGAATRLSPADRAAIDAALDCCGLRGLADRRFDTLSGGERQKTMIAAALAQTPELLCLDEPTNGLDPAYQVELVRILRDWRRERADDPRIGASRSILLVSHDLNLPAALGGRVVALRDGRVVADGAVDDVLTPNRLAAIYGGPFDVATTSAGHRLIAPAWW